MEPAPNEIRAVTPSGRRRRKLRAPNPEVRKRLLGAAHWLIGEHTDDGLHIDEVAERAGVSVGTFYLYFDGKDDLLTAMVVRLVEELCEAQRLAMASGDGALDRLTRGVDAYMEAAASRENAFLWYKAPRRIRTTAGDLTSWACECQAAVWAPILESGMLSGDLLRQDVELLSQTLVAMLQHMVGYWLDHRPRIDRDTTRKFLLNSMRFMVLGKSGDAA